MSITAVVILVNILYVIVLLVIGYYGYRKTKMTPMDYFLGNKELGPIVLTLTFIATYASMWTFLGAVGANYRLGPSFMGSMITWNLMWPLMIWVIGTRLWLLGAKFNYITPSDLFADYYQSESIRWIASVVGIIALIPYMSIQLLGGALAFEAATQGAIPYWGGALFMVIIIMIYTIVGGLRAVAWTDVFQGIFFLVVLGVLSIWTISLGGGGNVFKDIAARHPEIFAVGRFAWPLWFGFVMTWGLSPILPHMLQRSFMAKSQRVLAQSAFSLAILSPWIQTITVMIIGVSAIVILPGLKGAATDAIIPTLLAKYYPYLGAVIVAAAMSAGMSTLDSQLLSASSLVTRDLYVRYMRPNATPREETITGKIFVIVITIAMFIFVLTKPGFIVVLGTAGAGICIAGYIFPIIGALFWPRVGKVAALGGLLVGGVVALLTFAVWKFPLGFHNSLWGLACGLVAFLILTFITKPVPLEQQEKFHGYLASVIHLNK